ncbi:SRPBCC family protein [Fodinicola feengrottensis]|uniref:SRPBCC family protein n=1 Tax=Fodinicola feengrottensis TaxID=435914 RepID=A0ABN2J705_9ACTN|nr:SRPBCC family protein [Fodinicola feengrottensis]
MEEVTVERVVAAPVEEVFDWLATTTNYTRSRWVLRARLARAGSGAPYGVGAIRLHTWVIGWFRERITAYHRPRGFDYVVERSIPPSRHEGGRMTFTEVPGGTCVRWSTTAEVRLPFAATITRLLVRPLLIRAFTAILDTADTALRTTGSTGPNRSL